MVTNQKSNFITLIILVFSESKIPSLQFRGKEKEIALCYNGTTLQRKNANNYLEFYRTIGI